MRLLDHVSISVRDLSKCRPFYLAIMSALDVVVAYDEESALGFGERNRRDDDVHSYVTVRQSADASGDDARHWCFRARSAQAVGDFYAAGMAAGGWNAGRPGLRLHYHAHYYAAFLLDPDGNKIEAVYHQGES